MKKDEKDIEGGRCIKGKDGKLGFSKKASKKMWKNQMEKKEKERLGSHDRS